MPPRYEIRAYDWNGNQQFVLDEWDDDGLTYTNKINDVGTFSFTMDLDDTRWMQMQRDWIIQVVRQDPDNGIAPYADFTGLYRNRSKKITQHNRKFVASGVDLKHFLKRRAIMYLSGAALASQNTFADDAAKNFVLQNAGIAATAPPRMKSGVFPSFNVASNIGAVPTIWQGARQFTNLLDTVREIAIGCLFDFDVTLDSLSPLSFTFRTYYPFIGTDRSVGNTLGNIPMRFTPKTGFCIDPEYTESTEMEITSMMVLGSGSQSNRLNLLVQDNVNNSSSGGLGGHLTASPWNDIEGTLSQPQDGANTSLFAMGLFELAKNAAKVNMKFSLNYVTGCVYGKDWKTGDFCTIGFDDRDSFEGVTSQIGPGVENKRITSTTVSVKKGTEDVKPDFTDIGQ